MYDMSTSGAATSDAMDDEPRRARASVVAIMNPASVRALLEQVARGERPVDEALRELEDLPYRDLGFARVDHHRHLRRGAREVVVGLGKSAGKIAAILVELRKHGAPVLATRVDAEKAGAVLAAVPGARYLDGPRAVVVNWEGEASFVDRGRGV